MSGYQPPPGPYGAPGGGQFRPPGAPPAFPGAGPPPPAGVRPAYGAAPGGPNPPAGPFAAPPPGGIPNGPGMPFPGGPPSSAGLAPRPGFAAGAPLMPPPGQPGAPPAPFSAGPRPPSGGGMMAPPQGPGSARPAMPPAPGMAPPGMPGMAPPGMPGMAPPGMPGMTGMRPPMPGGASVSAGGAPQMPGPPSGMQPPAPPFAPGMPGPPGAAAGMMPPPPGSMAPPGMAPGMPLPPMGQQMPGGPSFGGYGAQYGAQQLVEQFESLAMGAAPGQPEVDLAAVPRPCGPHLQQAIAPAPVVDQANCSPINMRMSVNAIPSSTALRARWPLPVGLIVQPMADDAAGNQVPVVPLGNAGIVRCRRCRTYMNPFMQWQDGGRRFKCNVCGMGNEAPPEYYCQLDANGRRLDSTERPELSRGTVEYVAPAEYMVRPPMPPVFFFVIDVSYTAVASGMVATVATAIKESLDKLPGDERTLVGFLTFDSTLHFYNLKPGLTQPQSLVVSELDEPFLPLPDDMLVNLSESRQVVEALLDSLPTMFTGNMVQESAMGPALQAAFLVTNHVGGKMLLFQSGVPSLGAGKVRQRENYALYNTEREATLRQPEDGFYKRFAGECSRVQTTLDVFAFNSQYMDLASLATIAHYNSGQVYYYPGFNAARDGPKLHAELCHNLARPTAWEAVMRIRCSKGIKISHFHGHFFNRSTDLLALPTCSPDMAYAVQLQHEEAVVTSNVTYIQCALLYTSSSGERRIRVHTMVVPVVSELADMYRAVDAGATAVLLAKLAVERSAGARLEDCRQAIQAKVVGALKEFRMMHAAQLRGGGRLIFPEQLRYLPIFTLGLLKSTAIRGGARDVNPDERIVVGHELVAAPVELLLRMLYPAAYPLHDPAGDWGQLAEGSGATVLPETVPLSLSYMVEGGAYLIDTGRMLILWLGRALAPQWVADVFGLPLANIPSETSQLVLEPAKAHPMSKRVCALVDALRGCYGVHQEVFIVRQGTPLEAHVVPYFIEDRSHGQLSYADWVMALHKAVMSK